MNKETPFERLRLDVCLAAEQWFMHRAKRGIPHTKTLAEAEAALEEVAGRWLDTKIALIHETIENGRRASPDGKTSWDRVEDYRIKHGHLPAQDGSKEPGCKVCQKERP